MHLFFYQLQSFFWPGLCMQVPLVPLVPFVLMRGAALRRLRTSVGVSQRACSTADRDRCASPSAATRMYLSRSGLLAPIRKHVAAALPGSRIERTRRQAGTPDSSHRRCRQRLCRQRQGHEARAAMLLRRVLRACATMLGPSAGCSLLSASPLAGGHRSRSASARLPAHQPRTISCLFCGS